MYKDLGGGPRHCLFVGQLADWQVRAVCVCVCVCGREGGGEWVLSSIIPRESYNTVHLQ